MLYCRETCCSQGGNLTEPGGTVTTSLLGHPASTLTLVCRKVDGFPTWLGVDNSETRLTAKLDAMHEQATNSSNENSQSFDKLENLIRSSCGVGQGQPTYDTETTYDRSEETTEYTTDYPDYTTTDYDGGLLGEK